MKENNNMIAIAFKHKFTKEKRILYNELDTFVYDFLEIKENEIIIDYKESKTTIKREDVLFFIEGDIFCLSDNVINYKKDD